MTPPSRARRRLASQIGASSAACVLSQSRRAEFIRDCQRGPVARKASRMSASYRTVAGFLVGAFCGPRTPSFSRKLGGSASPAGLKSFASAAVNSLTSPASLVNRERFAIAFRLSLVSFAETDHPDSGLSLCETHYVQPLVQVAECDISDFPVRAAIVDRNEGRREVKLSGSVEGKSAFSDIPSAFIVVVSNVHYANCTYKKDGNQGFLYVRSDGRTFEPDRRAACEGLPVLNTPSFLASLRALTTLPHWTSFVCSWFASDARSNSGGGA